MLKINLFTFFLAIFIAGCASATPPDGWLPETENIPTDGFGGWLIVQYSKASSPNSIENGKNPKVNLIDTKTYTFWGEFITADSSKVYILNYYTGLIAIPKDKILYAKLELDQKLIGSIWAWGALGSISTISHGIFLIFTTPIWLITAGVSSASEADRDIMESNSPDAYFWYANLKFARFPQGIPKGVDLRTLKTKKM